MRLISNVLFLGVGVAACAGVALAQVNGTPTPAGPPSTTAVAADASTPPADPDSLVTCKYEKETGSLFTRRICHSQREWKQRTQDARDTMERADQIGSGQVGGQ